jgi:hypothetical protein
MQHPTSCPCEDCTELKQTQAGWKPVQLPVSVLENLDEAFAKVHNPAPGGPH